MIKLESYWNDKETRERVKSLRRKLPDVFEDVDHADLALAWFKFSDGAWLDPAPHAVENFLAEVDIKKIKRGSDLLNSYEDEDENDELEDYDNLFSGDKSYRDEDEGGEC